MIVPEFICGPDDDQLHDLFVMWFAQAVLLNRGPTAKVAVLHADFERWLIPREQEPPDAGEFTELLLGRAV